MIEPKKTQKTIPGRGKVKIKPPRKPEPPKQEEYEYQGSKIYKATLSLDVVFQMPIWKQINGEVWRQPTDEEICQRAWEEAQPIFKPEFFSYEIEETN